MFRVILSAVCCICLMLARGELAVLGLRVSVAIPDLVKLNDPFWLNCSQNSNQFARNGGANRQKMEPQNVGEENGGEIYAIKWYKDEEEFYRFLPNAEPKVSIYETNGIQLDQSKSHEGNIFVSKADVNSEGTYRCEILSEAPDFETVRKSKHLKVYALPVRGPRIEILDSNGKPKSPKTQEISYAVGGKIELRCNSAPSKPAARLRWYLNDQELLLPSQTTNRSAPSSALQTNRAQQAVSSTNRPLSYDVRITPVEYRQHYKAIYSAHSTLSLILQQEDLTSNRISFKCLASMRQEIPVPSKQLIVLTPPPSPATEASSALRSRAKRRLAPTPAPDEPRHRIQYANNRATAPKLVHKVAPFPAPISVETFDDQKSQFLYVYEESDSTLGPSVIERRDKLERYLHGNSSAHELNLSHLPSSTNVADNLDLVQFSRENKARLRSLPTGSRRATFNSQQQPIRSPLYLDEFDPLRPVINWPPLDAGNLMLLPPTNSIAAIPKQEPQQQGELKFVLPPKLSQQNEPTGSSYATFRAPNNPTDLSENNNGQLNGDEQLLLLEKLLDNLNCTCTEGNIDTKLLWVVNEAQVLGTRDTHFYPTRVSPDHRQTWLTIGMNAPFKHQSSRWNQLLNNNNNNQHSIAASQLQLIMEQFYQKKARPLAGSQRATPSSDQIGLGPLGAANMPTNQLESAATTLNGQHIKFMCQALHSMLLYSGSELITFDFNPPHQTAGAPTSDGDMSNGRQAPFANNVIQATQASQSRSSASNSIHRVNFLFPKDRSQLNLFTISLMLLSHVLAITINVKFSKPQEI